MTNQFKCTKTSSTANGVLGTNEIRQKIKLESLKPLTLTSSCLTNDLRYSLLLDFAVSDTDLLFIYPTNTLRSYIGTKYRWCT